MHFSDHRAAQTGPPAGATATTKLPVPVSSLRWALVRRLVLAIPLGLLFGVMLINGFKVNESAILAAMAGGAGLSFSLFLGIIRLGPYSDTKYYRWIGGFGPGGDGGKGDWG